MFRRSAFCRASGACAVLALLGCSSGHAASGPRPSPEPHACANVPASAPHRALQLRSLAPIPRVQVPSGTVVTVAVSYQDKLVQVPKVHGDRSSVCLVRPVGRPARAVQVEYLALKRGNVTVSSGLVITTRANMPALSGRIVVR